jgi:DNA-binding XRE family transcriptional regulator
VVGPRQADWSGEAAFQKLGERRRPKKLRTIREAFPMTQGELARETGLSESTVAALEKGRRRPHPSTKRELAHALRVKVEDILWP